MAVPLGVGGPSLPSPPMARCALLVSVASGKGSRSHGSGLVVPGCHAPVASLLRNGPWSDMPSDKPCGRSGPHGPRISGSQEVRQQNATIAGPHPGATGTCTRSGRGGSIRMHAARSRRRPPVAMPCAPWRASLAHPSMALPTPPPRPMRTLYIAVESTGQDWANSVQSIGHLFKSSWTGRWSLAQVGIVRSLDMEQRHGVPGRPRPWMTEGATGVHLCHNFPRAPPTSSPSRRPSRRRPAP